MDAQEQAKAYFRAISGATLEDFTALFSEDAHFEDPVGGHVHQGHEGIAKFHKGLRRAWSSIEMTGDSVFERGNRVAVLWSATGRSATEKDIAFEGINVFQFNAEGLITRLESYWDFEDVIGQM